jgi:hypothetical protein
MTLLAAPGDTYHCYTPHDNNWGFLHCFVTPHVSLEQTGCLYSCLLPPHSHPFTCSLILPCIIALRFVGDLCHKGHCFPAIPSPFHIYHQLLSWSDQVSPNLQEQQHMRNSR